MLCKERLENIWRLSISCFSWGSLQLPPCEWAQDRLMDDERYVAKSSITSGDVEPIPRHVSEVTLDHSAPGKPAQIRRTTPPNHRIIKIMFVILSGWFIIQQKQTVTKGSHLRGLYGPDIELVVPIISLNILHSSI